jgi:hypothetical protein
MKLISRISATSNRPIISARINGQLTIGFGLLEKKVKTISGKLIPF